MLRIINSRYTAAFRVFRALEAFKFEPNVSKLCAYVCLSELMCPFDFEYDVPMIRCAHGRLSVPMVAYQRL